MNFRSKLLTKTNYPQFDIKALDGKKFNIAKRDNILLKDGTTSYSMRNIGPVLYSTMRPIVLNSLTNSPCIGDTFSDCLVVTKTLIAEENADVDISISGFALHSFSSFRQYIHRMMMFCIQVTIRFHR